ncbi:DUF805 domain-containing protein [Streptococcus ferus]|uniref:DUF805 domain-containing protein n=1 Tax=Streptococcus ferus TaxID=1345 RepID=UPI00359F6BCA
MIDAYKKYWKQYSDFSGRSTRSDFWWAFLCNALISLPFVLIFYVTFILTLFRIFGEMAYYGNDYEPTADHIVSLFAPGLTVMGFVYLFLIVFSLATLVPNLAIAVRRLRDAGFHWGFIFLNLVPFGAVALLVMYCLPTKLPDYYYQPNASFTNQNPYHQDQPTGTGFNQSNPYQNPNQTNSQSTGFAEGQDQTNQPPQN